MLRLTTMSLIMAGVSSVSGGSVAGFSLLLLDAAVGVELADIGPQIGDLLLVF